MIATAQTIPVDGDVAANLAQHLELAGSAPSASLMVFPELSLTGYALPDADALAFTLDDPRLAPLRALARDQATTLVVGAPVRLVGRLHIASLVLARDGSVRVYTKRRLGAFAPHDNPQGPVPPAESSVFVAGRDDPLVDGFALAICADVGDPGHAQAAAGRGARGYLASMFILPNDIERDRDRLRDRAITHRMVVLCANHAGRSGGLPAAGRSGIWGPDGGILAELPSDGIGVVMTPMPPHCPQGG